METMNSNAVVNDEPSTVAGQRGTVSESKLAANRENAQKSTGPRTLGGKAYSRRNAVKHGLFAKHAADFVTVGEDQREYDQFLRDLCDEYQPVGRAEAVEVERIALCWWRLQRVWRYESAVNQTSRFGSTVPRANPEEDRKRQDISRALDAMMDEIRVKGEVPPDLSQRFAAVTSLSERFWQLFGSYAEELLRPEAPKFAHYQCALALFTLRVADMYFQLGPLFNRLNAHSVLTCENLLPNRDALDKILRYETAIERSLDRALDRLERLQRRRKGEPVLLQTPQKADPAAPALTPKKPPQPDRSLVEGQADSNVADQAAGGSAVAKPAPVACEQSVKRPPLDAASVDLD